MILLLITTVPAYTYTVTTQKVPMQFAPPEASGIGYVVSFAIGASIVTILLWILRFCHGWYKNDGHSMMHAYNSLPPLHLKIMWAPGGLAGTLWSIGNIASMVSVQNLGEGVGYSVTQASMVSLVRFNLLCWKFESATNADMQCECAAAAAAVQHNFKLFHTRFQNVGKSIKFARNP